MFNNIILLPSTQGQLNVTGTQIRASGATRSVGGVYTVAVSTANLTGRVYIEASLASDPQDSDWFSVTIQGVTTPYLEFDGGAGAQMTGFSFRGNFTWLRARLDRTYLLGNTQPTPVALAALGYVDHITLNMGPWSSDGGTPSTGSSSSGVVSVQGENVGTGYSLYQSSTGSANVYLNFKTLLPGAGIALEDNGESLTISTGAGQGISNPFTEYVVFSYTGGQNGNLSGSDCIKSSSDGVSATIVDGLNCLVAFNFTGYLFPPTSIAMMGQVVSTNDFIYSVINSSFGTRKIAGGGTATAPTLMGAFSGPVTLQLRMSDLSASAGPGQRAQAIVVFRF